MNMASSNTPHNTEAVFATALAQTRAPLLQARHLPGDFYTSPTTYQLEQERIFQADWLCVGRVEEVAQAGDYLTLRVGDEPIIVCRDEERAINAFYNVCRHRGTEVAIGQGNTKSFQCPYHAWTYDLKGRLKGAPFTKEIENFTLSEYGLAPLKVDTWGGFIFVNFDPESCGLLEFLADFTETVAPYRPEELQLATKFVLEYDCNWKATAENLVDIYHLAALHGASLGPHQPLEAYEFHLTRGGYNGIFKGNSPLTPDGKSRFGNMPWLSGKALEYGYTSHQRPNMNFGLRQDNINFTTTWPLGVERSMITFHMLLPKQHFSLPDFRQRVKVYEDFVTLVLEEDREMVQSLQKSFKSRAYQPGPMSKYEIAVHHVINYYLERIFG